MKSTLEKSRLFPFVAWVTVLGFAFVTYTFTLQLQDEMDMMAEVSGIMG